MSATKPTRAKTTPPREKGHGEPLMSTAQLLRATGYNESTLSMLKTGGTITPYAKGRWEILPTLGAIIKKFRERDAGSEDRARKNKAEADSAEADAMDKAKLTCPIDYAVLYVDEFKLAVRQTVERSKVLTEVQKKKLLVDLAGITIDPPEAE